MSFDIDIDFDNEWLKNPTEEAPIFCFPKLKDKLTSMGINIGKVGTWRTVGTVDVLPEDIGTRILFEDGGIFYIDDEGIKHRGFMYKHSFYFEYNGIANQPRFHIYKCSTIQNYGQVAYRFANAEPVKIYSKNAHREVMVEHLKLCSNCRELLMRDNTLDIYDSTDFVDILKEAGEVKEPERLELDIFGYVKDWERISMAYRATHQFTCERCGIKVEDGFDHQYIQTHHKNGNKTDNRESNLECLCVQCHSEVDDRHRHNFSHGGNKVMLEEFIRKYRKKPVIANQWGKLNLRPSQAASYISSDDDLPF